MLCPLSHGQATINGGLSYALNSCLSDDDAFPEDLPFRPLPRRHFRRKLLRLPSRNAQRFPFLPRLRREMFREKHNLPHVMRVMRHLTINRLHHRVRRRPNRNCLRQIRVRKRLQRIEKIFPTAFPHLHHLRACLRRRFKFRVAVPVRFFPVRGQKIPPARPHIPRHMFHDDRDGIRLRIQHHKQPFVRTLRHSTVPQPFVLPENARRVLQVRRCELVCHAPIFPLPRRLSTSKRGLGNSLVISFLHPRDFVCHSERSEESALSLAVFASYRLSAPGDFPKHLGVLADRVRGRIYPGKKFSISNFSSFPKMGIKPLLGVMLTTSRSLNFSNSHASVGRD